MQLKLRSATVSFSDPKPLRGIVGWARRGSRVHTEWEPAEVDRRSSEPEGFTAGSPRLSAATPGVPFLKWADPEGGRRAVRRTSPTGFECDQSRDLILATVLRPSPGSIARGSKSPGVAALNPGLPAVNPSDSRGGSSPPDTLPLLIPNALQTRH